MKHRQQGMILLAALMVVALVTLLATRLIIGQEDWLRQVSLEGDRQQAAALVRTGIDYAGVILADDERRNATDHLLEPWAKPLPTMSVEGGVLSGQIEDLQGRLNLNDIVAPDDSPTGPPAALARLFSRLGVGPSQLTALADWIDADSEQRSPEGAEDQYYLALPKPYRAANRWLMVVDELAMVRGFDEKTIERLRPYVMAHRETLPPNVNTASPEVLTALIPELPMDAAVALRQSGDRKPFESIDDFRERLAAMGIAPHNLPKIGVSSRLFILRGQIRWHEAELQLQAGVERQGGGSTPRVLWKTVE